MIEPLLAVRDLRIRFGATIAVDGISFDLAPGEVLGIAGQSGSGKSATALAVAGLLPPSATVDGSIRFEGMALLPLTERGWRPLRGRRFAMVFQEPMSSLNPLMTIGAQIEEAARLRVAGSDVAARVLDLLTEVGMNDPGSAAVRYPHQLSGGQQQRAMIAMALAGDPDLLIADEPTTALDVTVQAQILALLQRLGRARGMAMLFISHDLAVLAGLADRIMVMRRGVIVEAGQPREMFAAPRHPYTRQLLAARPGLRSPPPTARRQGGGEPALDLRAVRLDYPTARGPVPALRGIDLQLAPGEALGLVGESGSGKSTVARLVTGLLAPTAGTVRVFGRDPRTSVSRLALARATQMVFQDPLAALNPRLTVAEALAEPFRVHRIDAMAERSLALLEEVGLGSEHLARYPHQLSGGQRQRVCIARALVVDPALLVCDEPVASLDLVVQAQILDLLGAIRRRRALALLFIGHDLDVVRAVADRIAVMRAGRIVEEGTASAVMSHPQEPYTRALVAAAPRLEGAA